MSNNNNNKITQSAPDTSALAAYTDELEELGLKLADIPDTVKFAVIEEAKATAAEITAAKELGRRVALLRAQKAQVSDTTEAFANWVANRSAA